MTHEPTTYEALHDLGMSHRTAHVVAAVLPNLPTDESLISIERTGGDYYTDEDVVDHFKKWHDPVVDGSGWYRVALSEDTDRDSESLIEVEPVPHPRRTYYMEVADLTEVASLDAAHYEFTDTDQAHLSDFGVPSPYFDPYHDPNAGNGGRNPRLPV